jgi:Tol biopolymer transport system component
MDVWPTEPTLAASIKRDEKEATSKVKARAYDKLLFRHWDQWEDGKFSHMFTWTPTELGGKPDNAIDLTPGQMTDSPTHPFGGMDETTITADGKYVAFVARSGGKTMAWTTNTDVFWTSTDGRGKPVNLTADNPAYDFHPTLSPDGKTIALLSMKRAGFEADRQRIRLIDVASKKATWLTEKWDRSPGNFSWSPNSKMLYASADNLGQQSLFSIDASSGAVTMLLEKGNNDAPVVAGDRLLFLRDTLSQPAELFTCALGGTDMHRMGRIPAI